MAKKVTVDPPFRSMVRANGQSEIWTHDSDQNKMQEYGWQCGKNKDSYDLRTLMGNWFEARRDLEQLRVPEPFPSQFEHYFSSIYDSSYNTVPRSVVPEVLKNLHGRHPHAYPHHQPELDGEVVKAIYNSWRTTYRSEYLDPRFRQRPITFEDGPDAHGAAPDHPGPPQGFSQQPVAISGRPITFWDGPDAHGAAPDHPGPPQGCSQQPVPILGRPNTSRPDNWLHPPVREELTMLWNRPNTTRDDWLHPSFRQEPVPFWDLFNPCRAQPVTIPYRPYVYRSAQDV